jgi:HEAT repeat protein
MSESDPSMTAHSKLEGAFAALVSYDTGSSRAGLVPIDEAVSACLEQGTRQAALEQRLLVQLDQTTSSEARIYICHKLRLIGSAAAVPPLAALLMDPVVGDTARGTLELMPCAEAGDALRRALSQVSGVFKLGVVDALGRRGDPRDVAMLEPCLDDPDVSLVAAAATAIGRLGTPRSAQILQRILLNGPPDALRLPIAHACLDCVAALDRSGHQREAAALCLKLTELDWPEVVAQAARRAMAAIDN